MYVTNGYMSEKSARFIAPWIDAVNIDLKSFNSDFYKNVCEGSLEGVCNTIRLLHELGVKIEVSLPCSISACRSECSSLFCSHCSSLLWRCAPRFRCPHHRTASIQFPFTTLANALAHAILMLPFLSRAPHCCSGGRLVFSSSYSCSFRYVFLSSLLSAHHSDH